MCELGEYCQVRYHLHALSYAIKYVQIRYLVTSLIPTQISSTARFPVPTGIIGTVILIEAIIESK